MEWTCTQKKMSVKDNHKGKKGKKKKKSTKKITSATIEARAKKGHEKQQQKKIFLDENDLTGTR